ncbi:MAG: glycosyltransferase [Gemmatimonadota bacterium]|nr:glycosyltransferase [Gemmatimonadota bacterium]
MTSTKRLPAARTNALPRWTFTMLTIPSRVEFLARLLQSIAKLPSVDRIDIVVIFNAATGEEPLAIEQRIRAMAPTLPIRVYVNANEPSIGSGRRLQLSVCRTPLMAFLDDDLTLHGDIIGSIEKTLRKTPLGILGLPSYEEDSDTLFKPRESTPSVDVDGIRYMPVQGMFVAGYRRLFAEIGGFNPRRQFWGEWTELNLRMWRHGFPTGYVLGRGYLRHWHKAPESPTRNMAGREKHVLWGLMCTAMEYDAVSINEATDAFWRLAQDRYLTYSFGAQPSPKQLLASVLELMPKLSREWPDMNAFAEQARRHPFQFKPFEPLSETQVRSVLAHAQRAIHVFRPEEFSPAQNVATTEQVGWLRRIGRAIFGRAIPANPKRSRRP